ncbi:hypothetical protein RN607_00610 [Demequina capsici]|uniref:Uncharacterized protein n=1 Tax=Demequina capsici TaxID=3075620 RepID=A0AA96FC09_9MICO|nr:hypothetical protein [Demequina sp. PMTSA13]WNM27534.1 hypothetical protein RN607_00610 [Demequina sp. PMTSA13]
MTDNDYTPTTEEVRSHYADSGERAVLEPEFYRWLAAHDAELLAKAARKIELAASTALAASAPEHNTHAAGMHCAANVIRGNWDAQIAALSRDGEEGHRCSSCRTRWTAPVDACPKCGEEG